MCAGLLCTVNAAAQSIGRSNTGRPALCSQYALHIIGRSSTGRPASSSGRSRARTPPGSFANEIAYCAAKLARRLAHSRTRSHIVRPSSYLAGSYAAELVCGRARTPPGSHTAKLVCGRTRTIPCAAALLRPDHAGGVLLRHGRVGVVLRPGRAGVLLTPACTPRGRTPRGRAL